MYKIEELNTEISRKVETSLIPKYVKISAQDGSKDYYVTNISYSDQYLNKIKNLEVYEDDIWVVSFAKCGTTWTQEMAWMINNDLNYEKALKTTLEQRFPFLEFSTVLDANLPDTLERVKNLQRPRHIKSHLAKFLLPDKLWTVKPKIFYVARNPKDVAVSFYHHYIHLHNYEGSMDDFINAFVSDQIYNAPMNEHVLEFWKLRDEPNIMFIFFEDMKRNLKDVVEKTMKFLNKNYSQEEIEQLCVHLSIESMRANKAVNMDYTIEHLKTTVNKTFDQKDFRFVRKGKIGSHKKELTKEHDEKLTKYLQHPDFEKHNFSYKF